MRLAMQFPVTSLKNFCFSVPLAASLALLMLPLVPLQGATLTAPPLQGVRTIAYLLPIDEGYGLNDCLTRGRSCAFRVANAWCKAHGKGAALKVGKVGDITGSITHKISMPQKLSANTRHGVVVTCRL